MRVSREDVLYVALLSALGDEGMFCVGWDEMVCLCGVNGLALVVVAVAAADLTELKAS